ncbi:MAG TPA: hypothetical protein VLL08_05140 [Kineosporiaceae bacterium]|nr:hypothetical protein [Kineosporiaceae bacterium]
MLLALQRRRPTGSGWNALSRTLIAGAVAPALVLIPPHRPSTADAADSVTARATPARHLYHPIAVGIPDLGFGVVDYFTPASSEMLMEGESKGPVRFGAAVAVVNLDQLGGFDLVIGAPGDTAGTLAARVDLRFSATDTSPAQTVSIPSPGALGDEFGAAIAVSTLSVWDPETARYVWIGAPGTDVGSHQNAGAVYRYSLSPTGELALLDTITQDSALVPGAAETGDRFGEVLLPRFGEVLVGVPHEDIGSAVDAGAVQALHLAPSPTTETPVVTDLIAAASWSQDSPGMPGKAESGDRFGAALLPGLVGVPGEDVGRLKNAGAVASLSLPADEVTAAVPGEVWSQDSPAVPGKAEPGDQFGAALSSGVYSCRESSRIAVGSPGEDLRGKADAGAVIVLGNPTCPASLLSQGSGLPGRAEAGDRVGATLQTVTGDLELEEDQHDNLLIGAPGEDVRSATGSQNVRDAGRVLVYGNSQPNFGAVYGDEAGMRYGSVLSSEVG